MKKIKVTKVRRRRKKEIHRDKPDKDLYKSDNGILFSNKKRLNNTFLTKIRNIVVQKMSSIPIKVYLYIPIFQKFKPFQ